MGRTKLETKRFCVLPIFALPFENLTGGFQRNAAKYARSGTETWKPFENFLGPPDLCIASKIKVVFKNNIEVNFSNKIKNIFVLCPFSPVHFKI
jgi:hypothetical protein